MEDKIDKNQLINDEHLKVLQLLGNSYQPYHLQNIDNIVEKIKVIEKFSFQKNKFFFLWDSRKFLPIYASDGTISFGYTPQEIYNLNLVQAMKMLYWKQIYWVVKFHKNQNHFKSVVKKNSLKDRNYYFCGVKFKNKKGQIRTFFAKQKFLSANKNGDPILSFIEIEDISHIFNSEIGWNIMEDQKNEVKIKRVYFSESNVKIKTNLLSDRELDILRLVVDNHDSATIAQKLFISIETVKKHRKNMIAKTGLKDMTSLIYICKQCNIV